MTFPRLFALVRDVLGAWRDWIRGRTAPDVGKRIRQCSIIVDFSFHGKSTRDGLQDRLALRAKANRRLAVALGIDNSLTTADLGVHRAYMKTATAYVRTMNRPQTWPQSVSSATAVLATETENEASSVLLAPLVRRFCLTMVMKTLLGPACGQMDTNDVATVCNEINKHHRNGHIELFRDKKTCLTIYVVILSWSYL
ncbi:hypothetical protein SPBR_09009 [Sporothrix brasiliensis 5110]|uniref:Uncharacterized protein n=1 Tax=Sporothrix brasiliensis 5110 TaxID=1398154 RepID=A0A0C2IP95_9PEZI|nr:uncharacterized protein SPBR_09009 [Sporothrix brasiliensis 5110]KIH88745.1 hypothetical protein SPBR_09009 [Sporothrix brasiliensis 5110]